MADVFHHGEAYCQTHAGHLGRTERRIMGAIEACRTAALPQLSPPPKKPSFNEPGCAAPSPLHVGNSSLPTRTTSFEVAERLKLVTKNAGTPSSATSGGWGTDESCWDAATLKAFPVKNSHALDEHWPLSRYERYQNNGYYTINRPGIRASNRPRCLFGAA